MQSKKSGKNHIIKIESGEKVIVTLVEYLENNNISNAYFSGIGAVNSANIGSYILKEKKYDENLFEGELEVASLTGNVMLFNNKPMIHAHIVLGRNDCTAIAGHLIEATVSFVLEVILVELDTRISREYNEKSGLKYIKL